MTTYAQLQSDIANWIERDDLTVQIKTFITLTEQELNRKLRLLQMEAVSTQSLSATLKTYALPDRFISMRNIYIDVVENGRPRKLTYVTPIIMTLSFPSDDGYPSQYTIVNNQIQVDSVAIDITKNLIIDFFQGFEPLSDTNTSNWLTNNAYETLLYGSILQAEIFLYNEIRTPVLQSRYDSVIYDLNLVAEDGRYGGDNLRIRAT